ncbi:MAG: hypothetical protein IT160_03735 [Bryobacterales bacterium]|nr:hypothetical protein [Bryobacterales bacterium]
MGTGCALSGAVTVVTSVQAGLTSIPIATGLLDERNHWARAGNLRFRPPPANKLIWKL